MTAHSIELTKWLIDHAPEKLSEVAGIIQPLSSNRSRNPTRNALASFTNVRTEGFLLPRSRSAT